MIDDQSFRVSLSQLSLRMGLLSQMPTRIQPALEAGARVIQEETLKLLNVPAVPLSQLAAQDHPYAARHGSIRVTPADAIHRRTGRLASALKARGSGDVYELYFDETVAPHARMVIQGTSTMLPRDPLGAVVSLPANRDAALAAVKASISL